MNENISSRAGRNWINQQLGSTNTQQTPRVQVIPVPDLRTIKESPRPAAQTKQPSTQVDRPTVQTGRPSVQMSAAVTTRDTTPVATATAGTFATAPTSFAAPAVSLPTTQAIDTVDRNVVATAPVETRAPVAQAEPLERGYLSTLNRNSEEVEGVCRQIEEKFPGNAPCVIMFCSSEENQKVEYTAAQTAVSMTDKIEGRVLLIDSDLKAGKLSMWQHADKATGVCDLLGRQIDLQSTIRKTSDSRVDFLPVGNITGFNIPKSFDRLTKAIGELKSRYRVICVNVGDAHAKAAGIWSQHTCGCYLMVSMENTSKTVAKSSVAHLESCGARVMGCVVSEVTPETVRI